MKTTDSPICVSRWQHAASYAARAHNHQFRKDKKTPYIAHPFRVALVLGQVFGCTNEVALCAALLHDTIEDTRTDYDAIEKRFGREIADCVAVLTKNMLLRESKREADYDKRLAIGPWQGRLVKLADVYDNGLDIPKESMKKKCIDRCKRALELTENDTAHESIVTGRAAVAQVLAMLESDA
ncbi:MAG: HD domain-containing protein [Phycisphaerales bacterium]|nr:HD domain-containing protein [Phycisphaerales bacterium]